MVASRIEFFPFDIQNFIDQLQPFKRSEYPCCDCAEDNSTICKKLNDRGVPNSQRWNDRSDGFATDSSKLQQQRSKEHGQTLVRQFDYSPSRWLAEFSNRNQGGK